VGREARAASALNHPHICTIYEIGEENDRLFLAMELLEGQTLRQRLDGKPIPTEEIVSLGIQIADAMDAAHAQGIIHRDIKPANIFVTKRGQAKVLDFGLAKLIVNGREEKSAANFSHATVDDSISIAGVISGTPAYMSPEQIRGDDLDARTDVFSLGLLFYEMATGQKAFPERTAGRVVDAILNKAPIPVRSVNPEIPAELETLIHRLIEKTRELRYQSAADIRSDLQRLQRSSDPNRSVGTLVGSTWALVKSDRWATAGGAAITIVALAIGGWVFFPRKTHALTDKDTIVVADFQNTTGDSVFDGTLRQGLSIQLEQSPFLSVISDEKIQKNLSMMGREPNARITPEIGRELCQKMRGSAVLDGSISQIGTKYLLTLKAVNCENGESLAGAELQAKDKNDVLDALGKTASDLRSRLGESLSTVQKYDTPLEQATTPSLEALKTLSVGMKVLFTSGDAAAIPFFTRAIELDPNFAMAHAWLGINYTTLGETALAAGHTRKAYELRAHASEPERYFISAIFHKEVSGEIDEAERDCELWLQTYTRAGMPRTYLAGAIYPILGKYEPAAKQGVEAIRLEPDAPMNYAFGMFGYVGTNRLDQAKELYAQATERKLDNPLVHIARYGVAFLDEDKAEIERQVSWSGGKPGVEDVMLYLQGASSGYIGRVKLSREFSRSAVDSAERSKEMETAATYSAVAGLQESQYGNKAEARRQAGVALERSHGVQYAAALASAYVGDSRRGC